jgi:hypothetical protein
MSRWVSFIIKYIIFATPFLLLRAALIELSSSSTIRTFYTLKFLPLKMAPPFLKTCPNTARPAAERWHGNIQYCEFCRSTNDEYDAEAAALLAQSSNASGLEPHGSGIPPASAPPFVPGTLQIPSSSQHPHPASFLPGMSTAPVPPVAVAMQPPGAISAPPQAPPAPMAPQLLPSVFPFAASHVARPNHSSSSTYAAAQAQRAANARVAQAAAQAVAPHAGNRLPGALQGLMNQNVAGSSLMESQTVVLQLVLRKWTFDDVKNWRAEQRTVQLSEEVGGKFSPISFTRFFIRILIDVF